MPSGIKNDAEKVRLDLLDPEWLEAVGRVMTFGTRKYSAHNWRGGLSASRLLAACLRHVLAFARGEDTDEETGESHLANASCCLMMLWWTMKHKPELDDRWFKCE